MKKIKTKKVSRKKFERKMMDLSPYIRYEIYRVISEEKIKSFEFGREPGHRIYRVVLSDGSTRTWETKKLH